MDDFYIFPQHHARHLEGNQWPPGCPPFPARAHRYNGEWGVVESLRETTAQVTRQRGTQNLNGAETWQSPQLDAWSGSFGPTPDYACKLESGPRAGYLRAPMRGEGAALGGC